MTTKKTASKKALKTAKAQVKATQKAVAQKPEPQATETTVATTAGAKPAKTKRPAKEKNPGKLSTLDAAAKVLLETGQPLTAKAMIDVMAAKGYWSSPGGQTPHATLYAAILREIKVKRTESRFMKTARGHFALAAK